MSDRIENLEVKSDDLTKLVDETKQLLDIERRKNERLVRENQRDRGGRNEETNGRLPGLRPVSSSASFDESSEPETDQVYVV